MDTPNFEPERWQRLIELFHECADAPPEELDRRLMDQCPDDEAIRDRVRAMIRAHARDPEFLEQPLRRPTDDIRDTDGETGRAS